VFHHALLRAQIATVPTRNIAAMHHFTAMSTWHASCNSAGVMSLGRQSLIAATALAATLVGFSGVSDDRLSLSLIAFGLLVAVVLPGRTSRRSIRGNR
jgi:hypothetical protein